MSPALYLIDTSGVFRILQDKLRQAWSDHLAAGVIATCPVVELEFLYSARSLADRLEKRRLLHQLFGGGTDERTCLGARRGSSAIAHRGRDASLGLPRSAADRGNRGT